MIANFSVTVDSGDARLAVGPAGVRDGCARLPKGAGDAAVPGGAVCRDPP